MFRLLLKTVLIIIIPVAFATGIMLFAKDDYSAHSNEINIALAYHRLDSLRNHQKIILIAGSSGSWSTNSQMLVDAFHLPVVNTCSHAGMGMRMQFEIFKEFMQKGDIVVFFPEYYRGLDALYGESTLLRIVSTHVPHAYCLFSFKQWLYCFKYIGIHFAETLKDRNKEASDGPYSMSAINRYGDIACERSHINQDVHYFFKDSLDSDALDYIRAIHRFAREKGVNLIYLPPTLMERNYREQESHINSLYAYMAASGIPYQAPTIRYMFPDSLYSNTPYHMTAEGANLRTELLIEDMKRFLDR